MVLKFIAIEYYTFAFLCIFIKGAAQGVSIQANHVVI